MVIIISGLQIEQTEIIVWAFWREA